MPYHWEDRKRLRGGIRSSGLAGHICWYLGATFAVIGIVAAAKNAAVGLGATNWFLLAIVVLVMGIAFFMGWTLGWYLETAEAKKKE